MLHFPKKRVGWRLKKIKEWNLAFLTKLVWRIGDNLESFRVPQSSKNTFLLAYEKSFKKFLDMEENFCKSDQK